MQEDFKGFRKGCRYLVKDESKVWNIDLIEINILEISEKAIKIKFENGNTQWFLKENCYFSIIENLSVTIQILEDGWGRGVKMENVKQELSEEIIYSIVKELLSMKVVEDSPIIELLHEFIRNDAKNSPSLQSFYKALNFVNAIRVNRLDEQIQSISLLNDGGFSIRIKQLKQEGWLDIEIRNDFEKLTLDRKANGNRLKSYNLTLEEVLYSVQKRINLDKEFSHAN